ncbi:MAG TPA: EamA family transporter [Verrucomicrobiae bacterium]|nr:EamA family transporter [Verrucomicrobiae bacterium]
MEPRDRTAVVAAYAGMCTIWGTTWLAIKAGLQFAPPLTGVGLRFVVAGLALYAAAAFVRRRPANEGAFPWKLVAVLTVCLFGLNYILTYTAETRLDSGLVAVLFGVLPFFVFGFAHVLANERTTPRIWAGACLAFAGVAVISFEGQARGSPLYALAVIGAAASSAFANVYARRHAHHDPLRTLPPAMLLSGLGIGALGLWLERTDWRLALSPPSIAAVLYLALLGSSLAFFLNLWVLRRVQAWIVGLSALIIPVIAVAVGILLGGERFGLRELLGAAFVMGGMWIALSRRESAAELAQTEAEL